MDTISTNKNNNNDELSFQLLNNFNLVGFKNDKYENNCFVGVVFHSLFHFTELKDYLINLKVTINTPKLIIEIISLLNIYDQINKGNDTKFENKTIKLNSFRNELSIIFKEKNEFQLNQQGDPIELLIFILNYIHNYINSKEECKNNCIVHQLFYINLSEISKCIKCHKETILNYDNNNFIELFNINSILENIKDILNFENLNENLILFSQHGNESQKCEKCNEITILKSFYCKSIGKYFIINIGWNGNYSKMEDLCYIYTMIGEKFELNDLYQECRNNKELLFMGMILYWGNHYICLFYEKEIEKFIIYDDHLTKEYSSWKNLLKDLIIGYYQPVLIIYEESNEDKKSFIFDIDEQFYNEMVEKSKNKDKKEIINNKSKIKEDEWECEFCNQINNNNSDMCSKCKKINQNISFLLKAKYEILNKMNDKDLNEENKNFISDMNKKKIDEENEKNEKWVCSFCHCKTNLINNPICWICNSKRKDEKQIDIKINNNKKVEYIERIRNKKKKKRRKKKYIKNDEKKDKNKILEDKKNNNINDNEINSKKSNKRNINILFILSPIIILIAFFILIK